MRHVRDYALVVLGSAVHNGAWLPDATEFVHRNRAALAEHHGVACGHQAVTESGESKKVTAIKEMIRRADRPRFAGALAPEHYPFLGRVIFRAMGGRFGDHRNWQEIDAWAEYIDRQLSATQRSRPS